MASSIKATPQAEETPEKDVSETASDSPLLDLSNAAVKKLIRFAQKRGYVTHDQINSVLSSEEVNSEQIEDVLAMFSEMGVNVVETEEADEEAESESGELVEVQPKVPAKSETKHAARGTHNPHALRHRREQGPHAGRGRPAVLGHTRAHPPDRGQGAKEAEAPEPVKDSQKLP